MNVLGLNEGFHKIYAPFKAFICATTTVCIMIYVTLRRVNMALIVVQIKILHITSKDIKKLEGVLINNCSIRAVTWHCKQEPCLDIREPLPM